MNISLYQCVSGRTTELPFALPVKGEALCRPGCNQNSRMAAGVCHCVTKKASVMCKQVFAPLERKWLFLEGAEQLGGKGQASVCEALGPTPTLKHSPKQPKM